ncbi:MAG: hypothetical protein JKY92_05525 [Magnetovibrio sp.]|nr:hypothetical protein [Magnetovibrio sp.]
MMNRIYLKAILGGVLLSLILTGQASAKQEETCPNIDISGWFPHSTTPEPDNVNFDSSTICNFQEWSWQMFLWLTQKSGDKPRFLSFESPYDLLGIENRSVMMPRTTEAESFDEFLQAGTDGILVDHNGNAVYYSQYLNEAYTKFIRDNFENDKNIIDPALIRGFSPDTPFPVGSIELKASWKIVEPGEDASEFYTMDASVYQLANSGGNIVVDTTKIRKVKLALVGFHIGGIVNGHPEMIWATFEHIKNTPSVPAKFEPTTIVSNKDFTFYKAGTPYSGCNVNYAGSPYLKLDEATQKLLPIVEGCLQYEYGNSAENDPILQASVEKNDKHIKTLNKIVRKHLQDPDEDKVWSNYREVGSIWFRPTNALKPDMTLATDFAPDGSQFLIGSLKLSNSTIETFTQYPASVNNCFRCHNTQQRFPPAASDGTHLLPLKPMKLNISYAFSNIYFWSQQLPQQ